MSEARSELAAAGDSFVKLEAIHRGGGGGGSGGRRLVSCVIYVLIIMCYQGHICVGVNELPQKLCAQKGQEGRSLAQQQHAGAAWAVATVRQLQSARTPRAACSHTLNSSSSSDTD